MKQAITIFFLFLNVILFGQRTKYVDKNGYRSLPGITLLNAVKESDLIGRFHKTNGTIGYTIFFDSNHKFEKSGHDCFIKSNIDSGSWLIGNKSTLIVKSAKGITNYDVVKYDHYYFLILPNQRQKFRKDFLATKAHFKNAKPVTFDNITYTISGMRGYLLLEKYYGKELEDFNGT